MNSLNKRLEIVDISPLARKSKQDYDDAARKLYSALNEIGFAVIVNHGSTNQLFLTYDKQSQRFLKRHARFWRKTWSSKAITEALYRSDISLLIQAKAKPISTKPGNYTTRQTRKTQFAK